MSEWFWSPLGYFTSVMVPVFVLVAVVGYRLENRKPHSKSQRHNRR